MCGFGSMIVLFFAYLSCAFGSVNVMSYTSRRHQVAPHPPPPVGIAWPLIPQTTAYAGTSVGTAPQFPAIARIKRASRENYVFSVLVRRHATAPYPGIRWPLTRQGPRHTLAPSTTPASTAGHPPADTRAAPQLPPGVIERGDSTPTTPRALTQAPPADAHAATCPARAPNSPASRPIYPILPLILYIRMCYNKGVRGVWLPPTTRL